MIPKPKPSTEAADPALRKILDQRRRLPAWAKTAELLQAVANNQVLTLDPKLQFMTLNPEPKP